MSVTLVIPRTDLKYLETLEIEKIIQDDAMNNAVVVIPDTKENVGKLFKMALAFNKTHVIPTNVVAMFPDLKQHA